MANADMATNKPLQINIKELQQSLVAMRCDPTWKNFEETYNWFLIRQRLSPAEQDDYREAWIQIYNNKKKKGVHRKTFQ
jgi:hypothetical protein